MKRLAALTAAVIGLGSVVAMAPAASADPIGRCTVTTGTIVAVDFGKFGGPIVRGCGVGAETGASLLRQAGFGTSGTAHDGPAFICRLGNQAFRSGEQFPTPDQDACVNTPPTTAYWSFWLAPRGQNYWTYSKLGAASYQPLAGEVEIWQFGKTSVDGNAGAPSIGPDQLRAHNTSPVGGSGGGGGGGGGAGGGGAGGGRTSTSNHVPVHPKHGSTATTSHRQGAAGAARSESAHGSTTSARRHSSAAANKSTAASSTTSTGASGTYALTAGGRRIVEAKPAATPKKSDDRPIWPVLLGLALVVLLAGGAGWTVLRRRRADSAGY